MKDNKTQGRSVADAYAAYMQKTSAKDPEKMITENWAPMIERTTGVKDASKLEWMSKLAHNTAKLLNEDAFQMGSNYFATQGGVYAPYSTLYNTPGVGNPVPAGAPALTGADYANNATLGSGDKYPALLPLALKVAAKTIGFELVNTMPLAGPTGVLPFMDYVYAGSKQPYGATPAYDKATANPATYNNYGHGGSASKEVYLLFGLPTQFKATVIKDDINVPNKTVTQIKQELKKADNFLMAGTKLKAGDLVVEFIGWSRIDGDPMFKVISGTKSLGEYFDAAVLLEPATTGASLQCKLPLAQPRLISMMEDNVQGFTGAGKNDRDAWYGTYQDGTTLYEPMSRGTGEMTMPRQLSLQLFTKNVQVGTIMVGCSVTQEQVTDLQKQWGIDVVKMVENAGINELSNTINRHITSRLFALGWKNQCKLVEVEGENANMNITFDPDPAITATAPKMTPVLAIPQGNNDATQVNYESQTKVALPYKPVIINNKAHFENRDTMLKRVATNIMLASNWIQQRGRYGAATFVVTNVTVASALQSNAHYSFSPVDNTISQTAGSLYPIGTLAGLTIYVDPLMSGADCRVLVGRKGSKDEPGVFFCLYLKSRYALIDAGFYPET